MNTSEKKKHNIKKITWYISFLGLLHQITINLVFLSNRNFYSLIVLEGTSLKSRCQEDHVPFEVSREESFTASFSFWQPQVFLGLRQHNSNLCSVFMWTSQFISLCLFLLKTPVIIFRAHSTSRMISPLGLQIIKSENTLSLNKITL